MFSPLTRKEDGMKGRIWCDECGWSIEDEPIKKWFKKPCPECGHILINKGDIAFYRIISFLQWVSKVYGTINPKAKTVKIRVSSKKAHDAYRDTP
jgi:hypothetical protein